MKRAIMVGRVLLGGAALALLPYLLWQDYLFYSDVAPFHQVYSKATAAQDALVTWRMVMALLVTPLAALTLILAAVPRAVSRSVSRLLGVLGSFCVLAGLQSCATVARLPYGFGSGYTHINETQRLHLGLAYRSGACGLCVGLVLCVAAGLIGLGDSARRDGESGDANGLEDT